VRTPIGRIPMRVRQPYDGLSVLMDFGKKETVEAIRRNGMEGVPRLAMSEDSNWSIATGTNVYFPRYEYYVSSGRTKADQAH
jgi:hypothetical protein